MADDNVQALIAELSLNTRRIERQQERLYKKFGQTFDNIEKQGGKRLTAIEKRAEVMSRNVRRAIAGIAVGIVGREVLEYEASWRAVTNTLKQYTDVLGPAEVAASRLNKIAQDARAPLEGLSGITGAAARSARDLGKSGEDVYVFGEAAAKGARLANTGAAAVDGAFLQLSQAIASPRVQLQEFNSIIEGTPRLAQAFADGVDGAGGSVAKLRKMIADGEISGGELFDALVSQAGKLRAEYETLDQGPKEALTRLQNKLIEFVGTNEKVKAGAAGVSGMIDFVADNLGGLTDAIIIGSAALAGFYGAQGLMAVAAGLNTVAVGATTGAKAMAILRAAMAFMATPAGAAVGFAAVAAGLAMIALGMGDVSLRAKSAEESVNDANDALGRYREVNTAIERDLGILKGLQDDLTKAIRDQKPVIEATKRSEIAALDERIEKNRELAGVYEALARAELANAKKQVAGINYGNAKEFFGDAGFDKEIIPASGLNEGGLRNVLKPQAELNAMLKDEYDRIVAIQDAGGSLNKRQQDVLAFYAGRLESAQKVADLEERIAALQDAASGQGKPKPASKDDDGDKSGDKAIEASLQRIRDEYNKTFETERDTLARIYEEQKKAIDASKKGETEKANLRAKALAVYKQGLAEVRDKEFEDFNAYLDEQQAKADKEKDALNQVLDARDQMLGRTSTLLEREYELRRAKIANEIEDEATKNEALAALDEEYAEAKRQLADKVLGKGEESEKAVERIRAEEEDKLAELEDWYQVNLDALAEYEARKQEIIDESEAEIRDLRLESARVQLEAGEKMFNGLSGIAKAFAGKQSGIYKVLFATEKAFAIGAATIAMFQNIAEASKAGYPQNLALMAAAAAQGAAILGSIQGTAANFADGAVRIHGPGTRKSDSIPANLSKDESVINAEGTLKNENILRRINAGEDIEAQFARLQRSAAPVEFNPYLLAGGGRQVSVAGSSLNFYGPVDREAVPAFREALDQKNRELVDTVEKIFYREQTVTTPRHERNRIFRK